MAFLRVPLGGMAELRASVNRSSGIVAFGLFDASKGKGWFRVPRAQLGVLRRAIGEIDRQLRRAERPAPAAGGR